ncbi:Crp/Fnr family transcriptional regulator [Catenulispora sp. NF23]|uniref:Crp/Fnr family transcriptional regulator n=1 Tax=Catenulispora pinistramenti TaxID=2705254 RepID=UPI001BA60E00|nr:Crp/Fnr family transcriptional regulator [Catenulispora pinistramenti]MBS2534364.1 Crp/Fnr family transcriptional regulator [Catenulispora pinistramenti]
MLSDSAWHDLRLLGMRRHFKRGQPLLREGGNCRCVLLLETGLVRVVSYINDRLVGIAVRGRGEIVGEDAVLSSQSHRATVVALEKCTAWAVRAEDFTRYFSKRQGVLAEYQTNKSLIRDVEWRHTHQPAYSTTARTAYFLIQISERTRSDLIVGVGHTLIAEHVGTGRNAVGRALAELSTIGAISRARVWIRIEDESLLRSVH